MQTISGDKLFAKYIEFELEEMKVFRDFFNQDKLMTFKHSFLLDKYMLQSGTI